eukprot:4797821-Alexandrium_andersonii.AAC.1
MPGTDGDSHAEPVFFAANGRAEVVARVPAPAPLAGQSIGLRAATQPAHARFAVAAARMAGLGGLRWGAQRSG